MRSSMTARTLGIQFPARSVEAWFTWPIEITPPMPINSVNNNTAPNETISLVAIFKS